MSVITAVIPTLSNTKGLKTVLDELRKCRIEAVVVDNSLNKQAENICQEFEAKYLPQTKNIGFAKAVNLGVQEVKTEWTLILNDDVEGINKNLVDELLSVAKKRLWVAVTPVLKKPNGETENIGYKVLPIGRVELNFKAERDSETFLDGLTAACLLIQTSVFKQLKGFDETFFAYLEDVDFFLRLKKVGYHFGVATKLYVIHQHQATSKKMPVKKAWLDMINWWKIIYRYPSNYLQLSHVTDLMFERLRNFSGVIKSLTRVKSEI